MDKNTVIPVNPHYVYLGGKIKQYYISYAFCSCGKYIPYKKDFCSSCKSKINWNEMPSLKRLNVILH